MVEDEIKGIVIIKDIVIILHGRKRIWTVRSWDSGLSTVLGAFKRSLNFIRLIVEYDSTQKKTV